MEEVLNCPFCGSKATGWWKQVKFGRIAYIECDLCGAKSKAFTYYATGDDFDPLDIGYLRARDAWNRRAGNG